jgi:hypothetical protein
MAFEPHEAKEVLSKAAYWVYKWRGSTVKHRVQKTSHKQSK